jgi:hypothetical protein
VDGIIPYDAKLVLHNLIFVKKLLTLDELTLCNVTIEYENLDTRDKHMTLSESVLADNDNNLINQKAS